MTASPPVPVLVNDPSVADDLALALRLADAADAISLARFGSADLRVDSKPDLTPVSDADLAVERAIRELLAVERPDDAVVGEEYGDSFPDAARPQHDRPSRDRPSRDRPPHDRPTHDRHWVLDPIDGTKNFVRGVPIWATLIALMVGDEVPVGVVSAPALGRRWWAARGHGAHSSFGGTTRTLAVSGISDLADASLSYSDLAEWQQHGRGAEFLALAGRCWRTRGYGDFYSYMLVAEGAVDVATEPELSLWDVAALVPVVEEAGGRFTGVDGAEPSRTLGSGLATNGLLHAEVLAALRPA